MDEYVFEATGDACDVCQALDGTNCTTPPHPNCQCQIVRPYGCETEVDDLSATHIGPGEYDYAFGGEVTVICPDGTELGMSVAWRANVQNVEDFDGESPIDTAADELCAQCPQDEPPFLCC